MTIRQRTEGEEKAYLEGVTTRVVAELQEENMKLRRQVAADDARVNYVDQRLRELASQQLNVLRDRKILGLQKIVKCHERGIARLQRKLAKVRQESQTKFTLRPDQRVAVLKAIRVLEDVYIDGHQVYQKTIDSLKELLE